MSNISRQQQADLAVDAYNTRTVTKGNKTITIGNNEYKVLAVRNNPVTGYQGTVYQDVRTNEIVVAHRGTASVTDGIIDLAMVTSWANLQAADAEKLTRKAIKLANDIHRNDPQIPIPKITHTGHSLGGAHVEIQAHRFGHEGATFNGYGAVGMHGVPKGGSTVTNYVKAADTVSAASAHYGKVIVLAGQDDIALLQKFGYNNQSNTRAYKAVGVAARSIKVHSSDNFVGKNSILSERNFNQALQLAESNKNMIQDYRGDVAVSKAAISIAAFGAAPLAEKVRILSNHPHRQKDEQAEKIQEIINSVPPPKSLFDNRMFMMQNDGTRPDAGKEAYADAAPLAEKVRILSNHPHRQKDEQAEKIQEIINSVPPPKSLFDNRMFMMQNDGTRPDAGKEAYADAGKPDISKPLVKNASANEFREYGFAALLSDDDNKRYAALDSMLDSNVGRGLRQNVDKVYATQEREQEMARLAEEQVRQVDAPVMRMGRG